MSDLRKLDEEIARMRGWERIKRTSGILLPGDAWLAPECDLGWHGAGWFDCNRVRVRGYIGSNPPPFSSSWALAGVLFEEASEPGDGIIRCPWCRDEDGRWVAGPVAGVDEFGCGRGDGDITARGNERLHHGATPRLAAARRWVAWRRGRA